MIGQLMSAEVILLVEDNPHDAELTLHALAKSNLKNGVVWVHDGLEALAYLWTAKTLPLVVLLDLGLPKMDGLVVLSRIRDDVRSRLLPVIVLTGSDDREDLSRSFRVGANGYMVKPVDQGRLFNAVQQLGFAWAISGGNPSDFNHPRIAAD
jgi:two-component system response regulator